MTGTILTVPGAGGDGIGFNSGNDGTFTLAVGPTGAKLNALVIGANGVVQQGQAQSMVRLNTPNGYGSTNTKIPRFSNVVTNQGSDITYADSATLGASFTINTAGVYSIIHCNASNTAAMALGMSLNTTGPTVSIVSLTITEILAIASTAAAAYATDASWIGYLPAGSVVRPHTDGTALNSVANYTHFNITRVS